MQQEINKQAGNGYKPILMCGMGGGTIIVILEHTAS
jgi:tRNA A22 N-methylase